MVVLTPTLLPAPPAPPHPWPPLLLLTGPTEPRWLTQLRVLGLPPTLTLHQAPEPTVPADPYARLDARLLAREQTPPLPALETPPFTTLPPEAMWLVDTRQEAPLPEVPVPVLRLRVGDAGLSARAAWDAGARTLAVWLEVVQPDGRAQGRLLARLATDRTSWARTHRRVVATLDRWWLRVLLAGPPQGLHAWPLEHRSSPTWPHALVRTGLTLAARKLRHHLVGQAWRIGIRRQQPTLMPLDLTTFHWLPTPPGAFDADPFVVADGADRWLFFERMPAGQSRGELWVAPLDSDGRPGEARLALRTTHHLAFPQVLHANGRWWLVPDSAGADGIQVFAATTFPHAWALADVWLPGQTWVDPVLTQVDGRWWLTATPLHGGEVTNDELYAFWSDTWGGPWQPHTHNPVVTDVRWARNAGRMQVHGDALWRLAQDCGDDYGAGITVRQVDALGPTTWRESTVTRIAPPAHAAWDGVHTWTADGGLEAVDVRWRVPGK